MQKICPRCIQRINYDFDCSDIIHECNSGNVTLDQEDKVILGEISEEFGTIVNTGVKPAEVMLQGVFNKFQGQIAGVEGEDFDGVTRRGNNAAINRQRQHFAYIKIGGK